MTKEASAETVTDDLCSTCGSNGNWDPLLHFNRFGHWPTLPPDEYGTVAVTAPVRRPQFTVHNRHPHLN